MSGQSPSASYPPCTLMIHSRWLSYSEALAGVGLLNQPHRVSAFSKNGWPNDTGCQLPSDHNKTITSIAPSFIFNFLRGVRCVSRIENYFVRGSSFTTNGWV